MIQFNRPFYYRQRFLLSLVAAHHDGLASTDMQKKIFLLTKQYLSDEKPLYEFFPYKYGGFSLQCGLDVERLGAQNWLRKHGKYWHVKTKTENIVTVAHRRILDIFMDSPDGRMVGDNLLRHVYKKYPYYAINSEIISKILPSVSDQNLVHSLRPDNHEQVVFTIGYEGLSFERYVNQLIENNIKLLCDVRANPLSRKAGFSKKILAKILPRVGIQYIHLPELGIQGNLRRNLSDATSRQKLFADYRNTHLSRAHETIEKAHELLQQYRRIALTCFEHSAADCHRHCISDEMKNQRDNICVKHL